MAVLAIALCILCVALLAAIIWQTVRLSAFKKQMDEFCQRAEEDARKREDAWQNVVHDLRHPAAAVYVAGLPQNRIGTSEYADVFLNEVPKAANKIATTMSEGIPPRRIPIASPRKKQEKTHHE